MILKQYIKNQIKAFRELPFEWDLSRPKTYLYIRKLLFLILLQMCKQRTSGTKMEHILYLKGFYTC